MKIVRPKVNMSEKCWECGCEFEYDLNDIYDKRRDTLGSGKIEAYGYVDCPVCFQRKRVNLLMQIREQNENN